jgi:hypothetical protein
VKKGLPRTYNALLAAVVVLGLLAWQNFSAVPDTAHVAATQENPGEIVQAAYEAGRSGVWMETRGHISRILPDDNDGSRHQRFILDVGSGHTVLVSHNIDLADRIPAAVGDVLALRGRYEWNERGGVIHWTHHDPGGHEQGGWIEAGGKRYR